MRALFPRLARNERGISAVEFAIIAPPFLGLVMAAGDVGHTLYMQAVLNGTVQKAARDLSLAQGAETDFQAAIDAKIRKEVRRLNGTLADNDIAIQRRAYQTFTRAQAKQAEDVSGDGVCSVGENWVDRNFNNVYDSDGGSNGQGGAKDVVVLTVSFSYPRMFPLAKLMGWSDTVSLRASTVLANQPFSDQVIASGSLTPRPCA